MLSTHSITLIIKVDAFLLKRHHFMQLWLFYLLDIIYGIWDKAMAAVTQCLCHLSTGWHMKTAIVIAITCKIPLLLGHFDQFYVSWNLCVFVESWGILQWMGVQQHFHITTHDHICINLSQRVHNVISIKIQYANYELWNEVHFSWL